MSAIASDVHTSTTTETSQAPSPSSALTVLAVSALVIGYLCLYPFVLTGPLGGISPFRINMADFTPGDIIANVVLFLPWGAALGWAARGRFGLAAALVVAALTAVVLSVGFETAQQVLQGRVSSGMDVVANVVGALAGVPLSRFIAMPRWNARTTARYGGYVVVLWMVFRLIPFVPSVHAHDWAVNLRDMLQADAPSWRRILFYTAGYAAVFSAIRRMGFMRLHPLSIYAALGLFIIGAQVTIETMQPDLGEWIGLALAWCGFYVWQNNEDLHQRALRVLVTAAFLVDALRPFDFTASNTFHIVPFHALLDTFNPVTNMRAVAEYGFWTAALVMVWYSRRVRPWQAAAGVTLLVLSTEIAQTTLTGRTPDTLPVFMALVAGFWLQATVKKDA
ncbi:MAG: VanZ family protein [Gammaproteobacteria bacterium]